MRVLEVLAQIGHKEWSCSCCTEGIDGPPTSTKSPPRPVVYPAPPPIIHFSAASRGRAREGPLPVLWECFLRPMVCFYVMACCYMMACVYLVV